MRANLSRDDGGKNPGESALIIMGAMATTWWSPRVFLLGLVGIAAIFGGAAEATEVTVVSLEREVSAAPLGRERGSIRATGDQS